MTPKPAVSRDVTVVADGVRTPVATARLSELALQVLRACRAQNAFLSITLVSVRRITELNRVHLRHRGPTDVITFTLAPDVAGRIVADVYVCPNVARVQARAHRVGVREELARLVVHGTLHACGWEHPAGLARSPSASSRVRPTR